MMFAPITAIAYRPGTQIDRIICTMADHLELQGWRLAGLIQLNEPRAGNSRCDMTLRELSSGERLPISERRGRYARGCMLDVAELDRGVALASQGLLGQPDLLIINKFGRIEAAGGGFRAVIAEAIENGVPVLIAVPEANLDAWKVFSQGFAVTIRVEDLPADAGLQCLMLGLEGRPTGIEQRKPLSPAGHPAGATGQLSLDKSGRVAVPSTNLVKTGIECTTEAKFCLLSTGSPTPDAQPSCFAVT